MKLDRTCDLPRQRATERNGQCCPAKSGFARRRVPSVDLRPSVVRGRKFAAIPHRSEFPPVASRASVWEVKGASHACLELGRVPAGTSAGGAERTQSRDYTARGFARSTQAARSDTCASSRAIYAAPYRALKETGTNLVDTLWANIQFSRRLSRALRAIRGCSGAARDAGATASGTAGEPPPTPCEEPSETRPDYAFP